MHILRSWPHPARSCAVACCCVLVGQPRSQKYRNDKANASCYISSCWCSVAASEARSGDVCFHFSFSSLQLLQPRLQPDRNTPSLRMKTSMRTMSRHATLLRKAGLHVRRFLSSRRSDCRTCVPHRQCHRVRSRCGATNHRTDHVLGSNTSWRTAARRRADSSNTATESDYTLLSAWPLREGVSTHMTVHSASRLRGPQGGEPPCTNTDRAPAARATWHDTQQP